MFVTSSILLALQNASIIYTPTLFILVRTFGLTCLQLRTYIQSYRSDFASCELCIYVTEKKKKLSRVQLNEFFCIETLMHLDSIFCTAYVYSFIENTKENKDNLILLLG